MTEEPLGYLLQVVAKKYKSVYLQSTNGIDIEKYHYILVLIDDHKGLLTQKGLAEILKVDKSYLVGILNYLVRTGYVIREVNREDRRSQFIKLTDKAMDVLPEIRSSISRNNTISLTDIPEQDLKIFNKVLNQIQQNLSKGLPPEINKS